MSTLPALATDVKLPAVVTCATVPTAATDGRPDFVATRRKFLFVEFHTTLRSIATNDTLLPVSIKYMLLSVATNSTRQCFSTDRSFESVPLVATVVRDTTFDMVLVPSSVATIVTLAKLIPRLTYVNICNPPNLSALANLNSVESRLLRCSQKFRAVLQAAVKAGNAYHMAWYHQ